MVGIVPEQHVACPCETGLHCDDYSKILRPWISRALWTGRRPSGLQGTTPRYLR